MLELKRAKENPILFPNEDNQWEAAAAFNPSVIKVANKYHMLYRAESLPRLYQDVHLPVSTIGYAVSTDGINFTGNKQLILPDQDWETYGCEDPRVTKIGNSYYIFYTALSTYPFSAEGIKVGLAITKDFEHIEAKHPVTPFNAKAMALFPGKVAGKYAAILTMHTDLPPAKIAIAFFDKISDIWSPHYWKNWYADYNSHVIPLLRSPEDHVEVGAAPVKTKHGWLVVYSYIKNYFSSRKIFAIEAVLLDLHNPSKVIGRTDNLLIPEKEYELVGNVANIAFPSGALVHDNKLWVYYGAADTTGCLATINLADIFANITQKKKVVFLPSKTIEKGFSRFDHNPIIAPRLEFDWELKGTLNPAAFYHNGVHIVYRAFSRDETSTLGYAYSRDGVHIDERQANPIYVAREDFEVKHHPGFSGCEDPRITKIDNKLYMLYTAYNGDIPRVAISCISVHDFVNKRWNNWSKPRVLSSQGVADKNACLFPRKIGGDYVFLHRVDRSIFIDFVSEQQLLYGKEFLTTEYLLMMARADKWDNRKIGASAPPIETKKGWLLFYHGVSDPGAIYKAGAVLLDLKDPRRVLARTDIPLICPEMDYEKTGFVHNVVFPCGAVVIKNKVYLYYGGGDFVIGVAVMDLKEILDVLTS